MKKIFVLFFIIASIAIIGCKSDGSDDEGVVDTLVNQTVKFSEEQIEMAGIVIDTIKQHIISLKIPVSGKVEATPNNKITLSNPYAGYVKKIYIKHGMPVKKGAPLIEIENIEFIDMQTDYLQKKSQLAFLQTEYERQQKLYEQNAIPLKNLEKAKSEYFSMLADVNGAEAKLKLLGFDVKNLNNSNMRSYIILRSPINGQVGEVYVNLKQFVSPEDQILEITNPDEYSIMLNVYGKYSGVVHTGQKVEFSVSGKSEKMNATIYSVSNVLDPQTKTFMAHAEPTEKYQGLLEGTFVNAQIFAQSENIYSLPVNAIITNNENAFVYIDAGDYNFIKVPVELGLSDKNFVEIINYEELKGKPIAVDGVNYIKAKLEAEE